MKNIINLTFLVLCLISGISLAVLQGRIYNNGSLEALGEPIIVTSALTLNASEPLELIGEQRKNLESMVGTISLSEPSTKQIEISQGQLPYPASNPRSTQYLFPQRE
jgi:hypothetical protein